MESSDVPGDDKGEPASESTTESKELVPELNQDKVNEDANVSVIQNSDCVEPANEKNEGVTVNSEVKFETDHIDTPVVKTPGRRGRKRKIKHNNFNFKRNSPSRESTEPVIAENEDITVDSEVNSESASNDTPEVKTPGRRGRKKRGRIYNEDDDPETIKEKRKKRAVELKLRSLKCKYKCISHISIGNT